MTIYQIRCWAGRHFSPAAAAAVALVVMYIMAPGSWFVQFQLEAEPQESGVTVIAQSRWSLLPRPFVATWNAEIERVDGFSRSSVPGCQGYGRSVYSVPPAIFTDTVPRWVGALDCVLTPGETYRAEAVWVFELPGGIRKSTGAVSAPFVAP